MSGLNLGDRQAIWGLPVIFGIGWGTSMNALVSIAQFSAPPELMYVLGPGKGNVTRLTNYSTVRPPAVSWPVHVVSERQQPRPSVSRAYPSIESSMLTENCARHGRLQLQHRSSVGQKHWSSRASIRTA